MAAFQKQTAKYQIWVAPIKSILLQMVSMGQLNVIAQHHFNTPKDMWKELTDTFQRPSLQLQTRVVY